jgi:carbohydrate diacid regulator
MRLLQNLVNQTKEIIKPEFGVINENGLILACSDEKKIGTDHNMPAELLDSPDLSMVIEGVTYKKIFIRNKLDYIAFVKSDSQDHLNYFHRILRV